MQDDCKVHFGHYLVDVTRFGYFTPEGFHMSVASAPSLLAALQPLTDPRRRRGVRHPFAGVLALTFLGLLCRQSDLSGSSRWAKAHWGALPRARRFPRRHAT